MCRASPSRIGDWNASRYFEAGQSNGRGVRRSALITTTNDVMQDRERHLDEVPLLGSRSTRGGARSTPCKEDCARPSCSRKGQRGTTPSRGQADRAVRGGGRGSERAASGGAGRAVYWGIGTGPLRVSLSTGNRRRIAVQPVVRRGILGAGIAEERREQVDEGP
jgi:hypothetical protein